MGGGKIWRERGREKERAREREKEEEEKGHTINELCIIVYYWF